MRVEQRHTFRGRDGFTLLEILIVVAMTTVVLGGATVVVLRSQVSFAEEMKQLTLQQTGRRLLERLRDELLQAEAASVRPLLMVDSEQIRFRKVTGYAGGSVTLGPETTYAFQLAEDEKLNGADDNRDGRVDEGALVFTESGSGPLTVASNVLGVRFNSTTSGIEFSLDLGVINREGLLLQRTFTQTVTFRH